MSETFEGIDNLKKVAKVGIDFGEQLHNSSKDGLTWKDSFDFIDEGVALVGAIGSFDNARKEFKNLTPEKRQALVDYIAEEFDIDNENAERITEAAITAGFAILDLVAAIKDARTPPATPTL